MLEQSNSELIVKAKSAAIKLLSRREYTALELKTKLSQKDYPEDIINQVIEYLQAKDWQSEERSAEMFLRHGVLCGWGPNKIKQQMQQRGLTESIIQAAFYEQDPKQDWGDLANQIALKKFPESFLQNEYSKSCSQDSSDAKNNLKNKAKLQRFLYNRGFEQEHINYVLIYFKEIVC